MRNSQSSIAGEKIYQAIQEEKGPVLTKIKK